MEPRNLFTPSTKAVSAAVLEIADSAGASADAEMTARAGKSLNAAIKYFNSRKYWSWLNVEHTPVAITGPFSVAITAGASGVASASAAAGHGVRVDDFIVGEGFSIGTRVSATAASALGFNLAVTGITASLATSVVATRDFYDFPTDWKAPYTVRLLSQNRRLRPANRRFYDRSVVDEYAASTPIWYDLFAGFQKGKVRLLPPPAAADTLQIRYYRRMTVPTSTATADVLDIPQDYDDYLIAWAKWHFLTDKNEGRSEQAMTWLTFAKEGLATMLREQTENPDEMVMFTPDASLGVWDERSSRAIDWDYT